MSQLNCAPNESMAVKQSDIFMQSDEAVKIISILDELVIVLTKRLEPILLKSSRELAKESEPVPDSDHCKIASLFISDTSRIRNMILRVEDLLDRLQI